MAGTAKQRKKPIRNRIVAGALIVLLIGTTTGTGAAPDSNSRATAQVKVLDINNLVPKKPTWDEVIQPQLARRDEQVKAEQERQAALKVQEEQARQAELARQQQTVTYTAPTSYSNSDVVALAQSLAAQRGWTGYEWSALYQVGMMESGWNPNAVNASSGACGIPQALPCSKLPDHSVTGQIAWMLDYIQGRYGTPSSALAHEHSFGWY